ncbi:MBL fold metallo-hydrolase [Clostridium psychrophilum]|uniref:MBL fold metallo-hydrolase n=1 Tax=Clostridium psychrophilum TaxID=132926 RepID=UPI001C0E6C9E|nr:MBL fold metallo-hydrolase [Clostridium psychrophilum]MBU3182062.1 MBL fold metallo-hydrolase [Clostridium psychrophilum]
MNIQSISHDATVYIYDNIESYLTNVFFIEHESKIFIIDTFCGSESMEPILNRVNNNCGNKKVVVINTHFHWDHVWGNCSFREKNIISHEMCRDLLDELWEVQINKNKRYITGIAEKCLPNITFKEKIMFHNEGIELFHSPGHTADSISIFDHNEKILYVGDNLEKPIIYVENADISTYINTLRNYLNYNPQKIVAGHTLDLTKQDIFQTIEYLKGLSTGKKMYFESEYMRKIHEQNLCVVNKGTLF